MSWGTLFDQSGGFTGQDFGENSLDQTTDNTSLLRAGGFGAKRELYNEEPDMGFKKRRVDSEAWTNDYGSSQSSFNDGPQSWGQLAEGNNAGAGDSWNAPKESDNGDWSMDAGPTSWDQLSSQGSGRGRGRGQGRGRGRGRGGGGGYGEESPSKGGGGWGTGGQSRGGGQFGGRGGRGGGGRGQFGGRGGGDRGAKRGQRGGGQGSFGDKRGGQGGGNKWGQSGGGGGNQWNQGGGGGNKWGGDSGGNQWGQQGGGAKGQRGGRGGQNRGGQGGGTYVGFGSRADEYTNLSLVQKFERFSQFLKGDKERQNAIQSLENACMTTGMQMKCDYSCDEVPRIYTRQIFTGCLKINGIFLARVVGSSKKELKHEVYNKAKAVLVGGSIEQINDLKDPGIDMVKASIELYLKSDEAKKFAEGTSGTHVYKAMPDIIKGIMGNIESVTNTKRGLEKLIAYIKGPNKLPDNPVALVEQAIVVSRCGLSHAFKAEDLDNKVAQEGALMMEDICIARATVNVRNRKQCKLETYIKALSALKTKPIPELLLSVDSEKDLETKEEEFEENEATLAGMQHVQGEGPSPLTKASLLGATVEEKFKNLRLTLTYTAFLENNEYVIDNTVCNSGLSITCLYMKPNDSSKDCMACELYIGDYLITVGLGATKAECRCAAYNNTWEVITSSTVDDIMKNCRKLKPEDTSGPLVLDTVTKGISGTRESNAAALQRFGFDPKSKDKPTSEMVIVEVGDCWQEGGRRAMAFSILHHSATMNGMLLEWKFTQTKAHMESSYKNEVKPGSKFKCQIFLQGTLMSEYMGFGKNKSRSIAAGDVLFKMYETHDIVRVVKPDYPKKWIQFSKIKAEAELMRVDACESTPITGAADRHIVTAACNRISKFFPRQDEEQLVIGPGMPHAEMMEIQEFAKMMHLKLDLGQHISQMFMVFSSKPDIQHIVQQLKAGNGATTFGGYKLIPNLSGTQNPNGS